MLKFVNASVHHEMLSPLKSNVMLSKKLLEFQAFKTSNLEIARIKRMIQTIFVSS